MAHSAFISICSLFVLSFGLISCSKDSAVEPENFRGQGVKMETPQPAQEVARAREVPVLYPHSHIRFLGFDERLARGEEIHFLIDSQCVDVRNNQPYPQKTTRQLRSPDFKVWTLLPDEVLLLSDDRQVECQFSLKAHSAISSTHNETISRTPIAKVSEFANWNQDLFKEPLVYSERAQQILAKDTDWQKAKIFCEGHGFSFDNRGADLLLENLMSDAIKEEVFAHHQVSCRILLFQEDSLKVSPTFQVRVPVKEPQLSLNLLHPESLAGDILERDVAQLVIENTNSFPMKVYLSKKGFSQYHFQYVYNWNHNYNLSEIEKLNVVWRPLERFSTTAQNNEHFAFHIPAGERVAFVGSVAFRQNCNWSKFNQLQRQNNRPTGLNYRLQLKDGLQWSTTDQGPQIFEKMHIMNTKTDVQGATLSYWSLLKNQQHPPTWMDRPENGKVVLSSSSNLGCFKYP